ncbi:MAG: glycosyltransferase family 2 protein [Pseudomonadota bacterium]
MTYTADDKHAMLDTPVSVLMPVCNEEDIIERVVEEWHQEVMLFLPEGSELIFDDASDDQTTPILHSLKTRYPYIVIHHSDRDGFGAATKRLYAMAKNPLIFFTDSDGQYLANDFWKMAEIMQNAEYDMLNGYKVGRQHPYYQMLGSVLFNILFRFLFSSKGRDINSAFKFIKLSVIQDQLPEIKHIPEFVNSELYIRVEQAGYCIRDIPVRHRARFFGRSKVSRPLSYMRHGIQTLHGMLLLKKSLA